MTSTKIKVTIAKEKRIDEEGTPTTREHLHARAGRPAQKKQRIDTSHAISPAYSIFPLVTSGDNRGTGENI